jgi:hypothetical protein
LCYIAIVPTFDNEVGNLKELNAGFFVRNDYPRQPVPLADRRGWLIIALVWIGLGTDLAGAFVGVYLASGQTVMNALGALLIANILLGLIGGLLSYIGGEDRAFHGDALTFCVWGNRLAHHGLYPIYHVVRFFWDSGGFVR